MTTYLQIILETEHKQKWNNKKYIHKSQHNLMNSSNEKEKPHNNLLHPTLSKQINLASLKKEKTLRKEQAEYLDY